MTVADGLSIAAREAVLEVEIDRGERNSFSTAMMAVLIERIGEVERAGEQRLIRIRAEGPNFCLGRDQEGATADEVRHVADSIVSVGEALRASRLVSVCELTGDAAGFGVGLVAACDICVADPEVELWFPEMDAGLAPAVVLSWLEGVAGRKRSFELVASGRRFGAAEALELGIVSELAQPGRASSRVEEWLQLLLDRSAAALVDAKRFLATTRTMDDASRARASVDALTIGGIRQREKKANPEGERTG